MSDTIAQFPVTDEFLLKYGTTMPEGNVLVPTEKFHNVEILTPYCRFMFVNVDPPKEGRYNPETKQTGKAQAQITFLFHPAGIQQICDALEAVVTANFDPETRRTGQNGAEEVWSPTDLLYAPPGMPNPIINPLKDGTETWRNSNKPGLYEPQRGLFTMQGTLPVTDGSGNSQAPIYRDDGLNICPASKFYSGCYGRAVIRLSPYPRRGTSGYGKRGVSVYLQTVQGVFMVRGEPLGGFDKASAGLDRLQQGGSIEFDPAFVKSPLQASGATHGFAEAPQQQSAAQMVQQYAERPAAGGPIPPQPPAGQASTGIRPGTRPPGR